MIVEQKHAFKQIIGYIKTGITVAVIIAGDIYDRAIPSVEAVCFLMISSLNLRVRMSRCCSFPVITIRWGESVMQAACYQISEFISN